MDINFYGFNFREQNIAVFATKAEAKAAASLAEKRNMGTMPVIQRGCTRFHWFYVVVASAQPLGGIRMVYILNKDGTWKNCPHPGYRTGNSLVAA